MSYRNLLAALVAVALTGCLMPVQSPADGVPRYPDGTLSDGGTVQNDGGGQYEPVLTRVELNQPTNGAHFYPGVTFYLQATAYDQKEAILNSGTTFQWSTSGSGSLNIADTSTPYIQVSGATQGDVNITITATRGSVVKSASISITIDAPPLALGSIEVPTAPRSMQTNENKTAAFVAKDTNGAVVDQSEVEFADISSSNRASLTVNRDVGGVAFHAQPNGGQANWTLVARRAGTATTVMTGGTVTVTVPTVNRIVVGTVSQPTNASACAPTQWGVGVGTSGTITAVTVGGECAPYSGKLDWSVTPSGRINVSGTGATANWNAVDDGHATITAKSQGDGGAAFTASLEVSSTYPLAILVNGVCTNQPSSISFNPTDTRTLTLAKYKGPNNCDSNDTSVTWSNTNPAAASLGATTDSSVTLIANSTGSGSISATLNTYGTGTSINYAVSNVPAPTFGAGSLQVTWTSAKHFNLTWPAAGFDPPGSATVTYKLSGTSSAGKYTEIPVTGTTKDVDVAAPASNWAFTIKACNGSTTSCNSLTSSAYTSVAAAVTDFAVVGSDLGYYAHAADGTGSWKFLGLPFTVPSGGIVTAPRVRADTGEFFGIAYNAASGHAVQVKKAQGATAPAFASQTVDLGFIAGNGCSVSDAPELGAFPMVGGLLAFVSGSMRSPCDKGELVVTPLFSGTSTQGGVASNVTTAATSSGWLVYISNNLLFSAASIAPHQSTPNVLASGVSGQLLGTDNGIYTLASGSLKFFDTTTSGQTGTVATLSGDFDLSGVDASKPAYGLPSGELVFTLTGGGFGVATPTSATSFTTKAIAAPPVSGVTFTLGTLF